VTQVEWFKVIGKNPSGFTTQTLAKGLDTLRFPVEKVNWNECQEFVKKLNARPGASKAFGKPGKFTLPHENEWEYACRGGKGNAQPFYWGSELNGTQANCFGDRPYGTATPGRNLRRPCPVEDDNAGRYERHPWGLHHMLGNVWEWCENKYKQSGYAYAIRGGAWNNYAYECRAAVRNDRAPNSSNEDCGLRIAFRPD
jgi:formylglycine-generating enzyme required for sulfatase activity